MDFVNIDKNLPNGENMGGLAQLCIFGLWEDVATWPTAPVNPLDVEANGEWVGDVVMKAGKNAFTFYSTDDTSELKINPVGEQDGMSFEEELSIFNPGLKKKLLGFISAAKNENLFFIVQDSEGQWYLLGDDKRAAHMVSGEVGTGKASADRKGASLTFKFKTNTPRAYVGDVTTLLGESSG
ncbi:MAG TPA: hypothetical protein PL124_05375 [Candidatus Cloacimonadota bacterium]|nr:hypothetical protein [Candidatus Cloacimonadota bacterium]HPS38827.1 hypothetical protein [Candidatus Cloacimonadota bacterium]